MYDFPLILISGPFAPSIVSISLYKPFTLDNLYFPLKTHVMIEPQYIIPLKYCLVIPLSYSNST